VRCCAPSRGRAGTDDFRALGVVFTGMTDAAITIRPASAADAGAIGAVFDAAVRAGWTYLGALAQRPMFGPAEWDQEVAAHAPPNVLLVVGDQATGAIVGFVAAHPADGELYLLFVHPDAAGRGLGRRLLDAAHDALRAAGCSSAFLYVHESNARAIGVYHAAGYRRDGTARESNFRGTPIREVRLVRPL
jgi:ribosomal protein S18 acetylase RimI-like enzyme